MKLTLTAFLTSALLASAAVAYEPLPALVPPMAPQTYYAPGMTPSALPPSALPPGAQSVESYYSPAVPDVMMSPVYPQPVMPLFKDVKYRQERKAEGCCTIIQAPNPCYDPCDPCSPKCVCIEVCMPPCKVPCIEVKRNGNKLTYDFGRYEVDVIVKRDHLVVDYDN